jgi:hypothetical protein
MVEVAIILLYLRKDSLNFVYIPIHVEVENVTACRVSIEGYKNNISWSC